MMKIEHTFRSALGLDKSTLDDSEWIATLMLFDYNNSGYQTIKYALKIQAGIYMVFHYERQSSPVLKFYLSL